MRITATLTTPKIKISIDHEAMAQDIAEEMDGWWRTNFLSGKQPDGSDLPTNQRGLPLGVGSGSLVEGWELELERNGEGTETTARFAPTDRGKQLVAIRRMAARGVRFQGLSGESATRWAKAVKRAAKSAMRAALLAGRKPQR
jgi:hypothetical protein